MLKNGNADFLNFQLALIRFIPWVSFPEKKKVACVTPVQNISSTVRICDFYQSTLFSYSKSFIGWN